MSTDKNNLVYREQLDDNVMEMLTEDIGSNYSLRSENTKTIVAALNEVHGKDIISHAIGSPVLSTDTFAVMGEKINGLTADFKAKLIGLGISVGSTDKIESMIVKLGTLSSEGGGENVDDAIIESLRTMLTEKGVELTGEESLVELIIKVGEEFDKDEETKEKAKGYLYDLMIDDGMSADSSMSLEELFEIIDKYNEENSGSDTIVAGDIKQIAAGSNHVMILMQDGRLYVAGDNAYGQLGLGTTDTDAHSTLVMLDDGRTGIVQIACGGNSSYMLDCDGNVSSCGNNNFGQLGTGSLVASVINEFGHICTDVKYIAAGMYHLCVVKTDGTLWTCGYNNYGQLGLGNSEITSSLTKTIIANVKEVSCGMYHTMVLLTDGSVWVCGYNNQGQLGLGISDSNVHGSFEQVTSLGTNGNHITCGFAFSTVITKDGGLWVCGQNTYGQLGLSDMENRLSFTQVTNNINNDVKQVACGNSHLVVLKTDGTVWSCGGNTYGQLGIGASDNTMHPALSTITNNAYLVACGQNFTYVALDISYANGGVKACGYNISGQLGVNDATNRATLTTVSFDNGIDPQGL